MNNQTSHRGIGFSGLLTVLFIGLKLTDNIDWSWWWVVSPLWVPFVVVGWVSLGMILFGLLGIFACEIIEKYRS